MHSAIEQGDPSSTNVDPTAFIEQTLTIENDMIFDQKKLRYVWRSIDTLETGFTDFRVFESHMLLLLCKTIIQ